jgi:hypothetical protein
MTLSLYDAVVRAEAADVSTTRRFFRSGIPRTSRNSGTGLPGRVSGRRSNHLPLGGAVWLESGRSSPVSALSSMGVVAFFHRRKFHNRRHNAMVRPPQTLSDDVSVRYPPHL